MSKAALFALCVCALSAPLAAAEESGEEPDDDFLADELAFLHEEEIVVAAARHKQKIGFSPSAVIVITRRDIEASGATSLMELLRRYPAVHVYVTDPLYPTAMIRGTIRVLLLIDGREANVEFYPAPFYEVIPVGLDDVQRIEIVLGPNSALYGANAVSAVIHITTIAPTREIRAEASLGGGNHGTLQAGASLGGGVGPLALRASLRVDRAASWMDTTLRAKDLLRNDITAVLELADGTLEANAGMVAGTGRFFGIMGDMDFDKLVLAHAELILDQGLGFGRLKARAYWFGLRNAFDLDLGLVHPATGMELGTTPRFELAGDTGHAEAQLDLEPFEDDLLIVGADFRYTRYRSDQLVTSPIDELRVGVFAHNEYRFSPRWLLTVGARFDWNSVTDPGFSPRAALVFNPAGEHFLRASAAMAFRKPTLIETSADFRVEPDPAFPEIRELFEEQGISNKGLDNEILTGFGLGYRGKLCDGRLRLGADAYLGLNRHWIGFANEIVFDSMGRIDLQASRIGYGNTGSDFNIVGLQLSVEGEPADWLSLFARADVHHDWYAADGGGVPKTPALLASAGAVARTPWGLTASLAGSLVSARKDNVRDPLTALKAWHWQDQPAHFYLMAALSHRIEAGSSNMDLGLSLFNPFGARFREKAGMLAPDGSNYGGELLGTRVMATARVTY